MLLHFALAETFEYFLRAAPCRTHSKWNRRWLMLAREWASPPGPRTTKPLIAKTATYSLGRSPNYTQNLFGIVQPPSRTRDEASSEPGISQSLLAFLGLCWNLLFPIQTSTASTHKIRPSWQHFNKSEWSYRAEYHQHIHNNSLNWWMTSSSCFM